MGLRTEAPKLWNGIVAWCREIGIDWPEDDIARVLGKIRATDPDSLPDDIGRVLEWCREAERQGDDDAIGHVEVWRSEAPVEIFVGEDGQITHRLDPDVDVEIT